MSFLTRKTRDWRGWYKHEHEHEHEYEHEQVCRAVHPSIRPSSVSLAVFVFCWIYGSVFFSLLLPLLLPLPLLLLPSFYSLVGHYMPICMSFPRGRLKTEWEVGGAHEGARGALRRWCSGYLLVFGINNQGPMPREIQ
jgi:hypothetical protein